ncbi:hypothetical protein CTRI78_v007799 [Colletotrichum trifolii]|uniref:C2H2-type domain-containing protein n=1 Tax=Colletotrichum trifolii TaxID=5466 RepID=A0A4R8R120_COLTR|nr:hypothetical protein CTRI78_v007799 [Colletotrichum trifolii]
MAPPTAAKRPHAAMSKGAQPSFEPTPSLQQQQQQQQQQQLQLQQQLQQQQLPQLPPQQLQQQWPVTAPLTNFDCSKYDYIPQEDGGFWKLQDDYVTEQLPPVIPLAATSPPPDQKPPPAEFYTCLSAACPAKPFKRKTDLERHYKQAHVDGQTQPSPALSLKDITPATSISNPSPKISSKPNATGAAKGKEKDGVFTCDYPSCNRRTDPFSRKDRLRIHFADVHKEDVHRKNHEMTEDWFMSRKVYPEWWRCTKCLVRIKVSEHGYECSQDNSKIEDKRREFREKLPPA